MKEHLTENYKPNIIDSHFGRISLFVATVVIAMLLTPSFKNLSSMLLSSSSQGMVLILVFPLGLIYSVQAAFGNTEIPKVLLQGTLYTFAGSLFGWLIYLGISIPAIVTKKRTKFFMLYAMLIVLLTINVSGCQLMLYPR